MAKKTEICGECKHKTACRQTKLACHHFQYIDMRFHTCDNCGLVDAYDELKEENRRLKKQLLDEANKWCDEWNALVDSLNKEIKGLTKELAKKDKEIAELELLSRVENS